MVYSLSSYHAARRSETVIVIRTRVAKCDDRVTVVEEGRRPGAKRKVQRLNGDYHRDRRSNTPDGKLAAAAGARQTRSRKQRRPRMRRPDTKARSLLALVLERWGTSTRDCGFRREQCCRRKIHAFIPSAPGFHLPRAAKVRNAFMDEVAADGPDSRPARAHILFAPLSSDGGGSNRSIVGGSLVAVSAHVCQSLRLRGNKR
jgi:hypothetical protein